MGRVSALEVRRKTFHIFIGTVLAVLFYFEFVGRLHFLLLFVSLALTFLLYLHFKIPLVHQMLVLMERDENMRTFPGLGALFLVLGATLAVWLFPRDVASAAIMVLAWGDGVAGLVRPYGKVLYINPQRTWEGVFVAVVVASVAAAFFVSFLQAVAGASAAMLIEGLETRAAGWKIDDNLVVPLVAGAVMVAVGMI